MLPTVGRVSHRPNARLHLAILGLAHCGAGTGRIIGHAVPLEPGQARLVCLRCVRRVRELVDQALAETMRRRDSGAPRRMATLNRTADILRPTAQVVVDDALATGIRTRITAAQCPQPVIQLRPTDADTGQLVLFPAAS